MQIKVNTEEYGEKPALIVWAKEVHDSTQCPTSRRIAKEILNMLYMPEIIIALHFEASMGEYFDKTSEFYCTPEN